MPIHTLLACGWSSQDLKLAPAQCRDIIHALSVDFGQSVVVVDTSNEIAGDKFAGGGTESQQDCDTHPLFLTELGNSVPTKLSNSIPPGHALHSVL